MSAMPLIAARMRTSRDFRIVPKSVVGVVHPAYVLFKPNDGGEFVDWDARHVDGVLTAVCVGVTYRHATGHYLAIVDG
jgi:hypothetical protein